MLDSDRDATIAQFLRWSHDTVGEADELMDIVRSDAEAAGVHFDDAEVFQALVLGLDKFVSSIKGVYQQIGVADHDQDAEPETAQETEAASGDGAEQAA